MAKQHTNEYFEGFVTGMESACRAAEYLETLIEHFDPAKLEEQEEEIHHIEHEADLNKHALMQKLAKEFITPIEREDIILLLQPAKSRPPRRRSGSAALSCCFRRRT